jgi:N-acetylmuramoyl-L-alanine amidase
MPNKLSLLPGTITLPALQDEIRKTEEIGFELSLINLTVRENEDINAVIYRSVLNSPPEITLNEFDAAGSEALQKAARAQVEAGSRLIIAEGVATLNSQERYVIASRAAAAAQPIVQPTPQPNVPAAEPRKLFERLASSYARAAIAFPTLKTVTLAQWALESGRGTSDLAIQHANFAGLKWRGEMVGFATPTRVVAHDGVGEYCKFADLVAFIRGYWQFLTRSPYEGWEQHAATGESFMRFIGPIYCPDGGYVNEVLDLLPEAEDLLKRFDGNAGGTGGQGATPQPGTAGAGIAIPGPASSVQGIVVLDPGHGGTQIVGGSSPNNAISASGIKEKKIVLEIAFLLRDTLRRMAPNISVIMTRETDVNVGISARPAVAARNRADLFLSLHCNGFNQRARGVETWVRGAGNGNVNLAEDKEFAGKIQRRVLEAFRRHDPTTPDRGIKSDDDREASLGVLNDNSLGTAAANHPIRACLVELEFIDVPRVDQLMNTGPSASAVRADLAKGMATAIIEELT